MPKEIRLLSHLSTEEPEDRYRGARDPVERSHYQIIWLITRGKTTTEVMEVTGYSKGWIQQLSRRYNEGGPRPWTTAGTATPEPGTGHCLTASRGRRNSARRSKSRRPMA